MSEWLRRLARAVVRHPWRVLAIWAVVLLFGAWGEHRLAQVTLGVEAGVPDSPSRGASEALYRDFSNPFIDPVVVAVSAPHLRVDEPPYLTWLEETRHALEALPSVRRVASYADTRDARLRSADGHVTVLLVGPANESNNARQQTVVTVRSALP